MLFLQAIGGINTMKVIQLIEGLSYYRLLRLYFSKIIPPFFHFLDKRSLGI